MLPEGVDAQYAEKVVLVVSRTDTYWPPTSSSVPTWILVIAAGVTVTSPGALPDELDIVVLTLPLPVITSDPEGRTVI